MTLFVAAVALLPASPRAGEITAPKVGAEWVTLGTQGGPRLRYDTAQISNALVVGDALYLFDLGNGVIRQMQGAKLPLANLRAAFITHHHRDHDNDMGVVMVEYSSFKAKNAGPLKIIGPPGTVAMATALETANAATRLPEAHGPESQMVTSIEALDLPGPLDKPTVVYQDENIRVSAITVDHFFPQPPGAGPAPLAYAFRIEAGGKVFVYSGDTGGLSPGLQTISNDADVLVSEVMIGDIPGFQGQPLGHLPPEKVGAIALAAHVKSVVLTHYTPAPPPNETVRADIVRRVHEIYGGKVSAAHDLDRFAADAQ